MSSALTVTASSLPVHADEAHAHGQVAIAVVCEAVGVQGKLHQGDLVPVPALQVDTANPDVPVSLVDEVGL